MQIRSWILDGEWSLSFTDPSTGEERRIPAHVPGNVEIDLLKAGLLKDYWPSDDAYATRQWEAVDDWRYETTFDAPDSPEDWTLDLVLEGVDTVAQIELNGQTLLNTYNMFIPHRADVRGRLRLRGNQLRVTIRSAEKYARAQQYDAFGISRLNATYKSQTYLRKARHQWGWDNAPRLLTAGIWRSVRLEAKPPVRFETPYLYTQALDERACWVGVDWVFCTPKADLSAYQGRITLSMDGQTVHTQSFAVQFPRGTLSLSIEREKVKLWWPLGYGEPCINDVTLEMFENGQCVARWDGRMGIRTLELRRTETISDSDQGEFAFIVNGQRIYVNGTNWKPLDALHSRSGERTEQALALAVDLNCNMIRVWGGGVYEDHRFFDYCDEHGLMVWQDFMFACEFPPRDKWYLEQVEREAAVIIQRLRNHASLAVWCGDNEDDMTFTWGKMMPPGILPSDNALTRQVLREAVMRYDPYRSYVESSPFLSDDMARAIRRGEPVNMYLPEEHLYPPTAEFGQALRACKCRFIGETGPIIVNAMTDNPGIFAREEKRARRLWDEPLPMEKRNLVMHQMDDYFMSWRQTGKELVQARFGRDFTVDQWRDYALAINIICGDVFKDAIEYSRSLKGRKTGVLWWSLMDMWPMLFNYSVVDYDMRKKMPYYWIRQSQQPFCLMAVRHEVSGPAALYAANDTMQRQTGEYVVRELTPDGGQCEAFRGRFDLSPNGGGLIQQLPESGVALWLIEWAANGRTGRNHFVTGEPGFECWRDWACTLLKLYNPQS